MDALRPLVILVFAFASCMGPESDRPPELGPLDPGSGFDAWVTLDPSGRIADQGMERVPVAGLGQQEAPVRSDAEVAVGSDLAEALAAMPAREELEVILSVRTSAPLASLPRYHADLEADHPDNLAVEAAREALRAIDGARRAEERAPLVAAVESAGGRVLESFRVGNAVRATMSVETLTRLLAERRDLVAASLADSAATPPGISLYDDVDDGRAAQISDPFVAAGYDGSGYRVGLLDTGVFATHAVFVNPDPIALWLDCANTYSSYCVQYIDPNYNPGDPALLGGHGTAMADILVGNDNLGNPFQGVAPGALVDSTNVYSGVLHNTLSQTAVLRALNLLDLYDDLVVANVAHNSGPSGVVSLAADDLYDEGVAVVAPVGNIGGEAARAPANAHKVLGLGAYFAASGVDYSPQSGSADDGRLKPDVTTPTHLRAASASGSTAVKLVSGTCPAAAFAGGALILLRDFFDSLGWPSDPGILYAAAIAFGDEGSGDLDNVDGAGNLVLGALSSAAWLGGQRYLDPGDSTYIWFWPPAGACDLRAAIWWPEDHDADHNLLRLHLLEGSAVRDCSDDYDSIFQKVSHAGPFAGTGWWKIRIESDSNNPSANQKAFYLIHYRTGC